MLYAFCFMCVCAKHFVSMMSEPIWSQEWVWRGCGGKSQKRVRELLNKIYLDLLQVAHSPATHSSIFCRIIYFCVPVHIRIFSATRVT